MPKYKSYTKLSGEKNKASRKRLIIAIIAVLSILSGLLFVLFSKDIINLPFSKKDFPVTTREGINYDPPTEQELTETEQFKEKLGEQADKSKPSTPITTSGNSKKSVTPIMTSWDASPNIEVRGFIPNINEEGGICTLTLAKGDQKVTETNVATADASSVSCGLITILRPRVSAGKWNAVLSYTSKNAEGMSTTNTVEVE